VNRLAYTSSINTTSYSIKPLTFFPFSYEQQLKLVGASPIPPNSTCFVLMVLGAYLVADLHGLVLATLERTIVPVGCLLVKLTCLDYLEG
jgi:hypothetical protein